MMYVKPWSLFRDLLKTNAPQCGRFLGLHVGDKYVGLAVSDPENTVASPLSVLPMNKTNIGLIAEDFEKLISELSLVGFIVGYPFKRPDSLDAFSSVQVNHYVYELCKTGKLEGVKHTYWDESFASKGCLDYVNGKMKLEKAEQDDS